MTDEAAAQLGMKKSSAPFGLTLRGVGGATSIARAVEADTLDFAGGHFQKMQFLAGGRMGGGDVSGLIGQNLLGNYDMEYDLANGVVRFFLAKDCKANVNLAYWSAGKALSRIDLIDTSPNPKLVLKVQGPARINGKSIRVVFDSGAGVSFLSRPASARAGVPVSSEGVAAAGVTYGVYGGGQETFLAPFDSFAIGGEEIKNTRLRVADIQLGEPDMLIGADFFLSHRILVSKAQGKIYFTYNGGRCSGSTAIPAPGPRPRPPPRPRLTRRPPLRRRRRPWPPARNTTGAAKPRCRVGTSWPPSPTSPRPSNWSRTTRPTTTRAPWRGWAPASRCWPWPTWARR